MKNASTLSDDVLLTKLSVARHHLETALSEYEEIHSASAFAARCQGLIDDIGEDLNEVLERAKLAQRAEEASVSPPAPAR